MEESRFRNSRKKKREDTFFYYGSDAESNSEDELDQKRRKGAPIERFSMNEGKSKRGR